MADPTTPEQTVEDLLAGFSLAEPEKANPAEEARKARVAQLEADVQHFANQIVSLAKGSAEEEALKGSLVSLRTVRQRAIKAIRGVPDSALGIGSTPDEVDIDFDPDATPAVLGD